MNNLTNEFRLLLEKALIFEPGKAVLERLNYRKQILRELMVTIMTKERGCQSLEELRYLVEMDQELEPEHVEPHKGALFLVRMTESS